MRYKDWKQGKQLAKLRLGKQHHLDIGHGSAIVGILWDLELGEIVTIKFIDKIDFTVTAVALGQRIM